MRCGSNGPLPQKGGVVGIVSSCRCSFVTVMIMAALRGDI